MKPLFKVFFISIILSCLFPKETKAQPDNIFTSIVKKIFQEDLFAPPGAISIIDDVYRGASTALFNMGSLIQTKIASFPLTSTIAGVTVDLQTGVPELITESLGPIFGERAETIGKGKFYFGLNYSYYDLSDFRGLAIEDFKFTFIPDFDQDGVFGGEDPNDLIDNDTMEFYPDLNLSASSFVFYSTYGLTPNLDVGIAVPMINLKMNGTAKAVINSITLIQLGQAVFNFNDDALHPQLTDTFEYESSKSGIGDIALRLKYSFKQESSLNFAAFAEYRFPTGNKEDFLGTGKPSVKTSIFLSKKIGDFNPHLNIGYNWRWADFDSDEFEFNIGFDQKLTTGLTFAIDLIGEIDLESSETINIFPGTSVITRTRFPGTASYEEIIDLSNIPEDDYDHLFDTAVGFKFAPSDRIFLLGNFLIPLNDGGIRSNIVSTFGISIVF